jgi:predicted O-methyltransferase YrrM
MIDQDFQAVIQKTIGKDPWKGQWSVVDQFGGGWAVELEVGELLHSIVRTLKPNLIVETGTHKGFSALMMAKAIQQNGIGRLHTVDLTDHDVKALFERFKVSSVATFHKMHSVDMLKSMPKDRKIDFLWLDADHAEESVLSEIGAAIPLLKPGSYVGFHDALIDPREDSAVKKVRAQHPTWEYIRFFSARGVDIMRVP